MKVLILSHMYPRYKEDQFGVFVHEQALELKRQGMDVKVISPLPYTPFLLSCFSKKYRGYYQQKQYQILDGIAVYYPRYVTFPKNIRFEQTGQSMIKGISKIVGKLDRDWGIDLIHSHAALPSGFAGLFFKRQLNVPLFLTIHGDDFQNKIYLNDKVKHKIRETLEGSDGIILVSTKLRAIQLREFPSLSIDQTCVIANGINSDFLKPVQKNDNNREIVILSVSNLIEQKGVQINLKAIAQLIDKHPDLKYQIVGDGSFRAELEKLTRSLKLTNHVEFTGKVPRNLIKEYMDQCDIFSMPSWNEAFGIVYAEAMARGKPVIGSIGEGIEDVITDNHNGFLVKSQNVDALVPVLDKLLSDRGLSRSVGQNARRLMETQYSWENHVKQLRGLYQKALGQKNV